MTDEENVRTHIPRARLFFCILCAIFTYTAALFVGYASFPPYGGFVGAAAAFVVALILHNLTRLPVWRYFFSLLLNALSCGFAASAYFGSLGLPLPGETVLLSAGVALFLFLLAFLLSCIYRGKTRQKVIVAIASVLYFGVLLICILKWATAAPGDTVYAAMTFSVIFFGFYDLAIFTDVTNEEDPPEKTVSFYSFSLALIVFLAAIAAIALAGGDCDCDCSDGCDCTDGGEGRTKKGAKKKGNLKK